MTKKLIQAFKGMTDWEIRCEAGRSIQAWANLLATILEPTDAGRLLMSGALAVLLRHCGNDETAKYLRQLADDIEGEENNRTVN